MTFSKILRFSIGFSCLLGMTLLFVSPSQAQLSKSVGLLKADVTMSDGSPAADVPIAIFRGVDRISTTKSSPEGKVTTILQPNSTYRFVVSSTDYLYHEDTLNIGSLKSYTEFPLHIVVAPLHDGQTFELPAPVFSPRSQDILFGSHPELDRIVAQMKHNPKLSITATVYPDGMPKNKKDNSQSILAAARQNTIRSYFLGNGISESRFSVTSNTSSVPPGKFSPTDPVFPAQSVAPVPTKAKGKKKKSSAPEAPGMVPQYVEIVAHVSR